MKKIIIKDSEIQEIKTEIVAIAMMHFGIGNYRIQEGYSESTLYNLSWDICTELEKSGFIDNVIETEEMKKECISDMVYKYIKEEK